jgi:CheY-like chemotaxis protein
MDTHMPVLDGLEATKVIRAQEKRTGKYTPIIALTARALEEDRKKCLSAGMDGYIPKPIDRLKLYETIEDILKKGRSTHESRTS